MPDHDITIGELSRSLAAMEARIDKRFELLDRRFEAMQYVHHETYSAQMGALIDRVEFLEDAKRWTARAFVAAFLFPMLVGVIVAMAVAR